MYSPCIVSGSGGVIGEGCRIMLSSSQGCESEELIST